MRVMRTLYTYDGMLYKFNIGCGYSSGMKYIGLCTNPWHLCIHSSDVARI